MESSQRRQRHIYASIGIVARVLKQCERIFPSLHFPLPLPVQCHKVATDIKLHLHGLLLARLKVNATERNQLLYWLGDGRNPA